MLVLNLASISTPSHQCVPKTSASPSTNPLPLAHRTLPRTPSPHIMYHHHYPRKSIFPSKFAHGTKGRKSAKTKPHFIWHGVGEQRAVSHPHTEARVCFFKIPTHHCVVLSVSFFVV